MNPLADSPNPDVRGSWPALLRAARRARQLAKSTGTPLYVMRGGKIINALAKPKLKRLKTRKA